MSRHCLTAWLMILGLFLAGPPALAQSAAEEDPYLLREADWPCHGRYRETYSAGAFWQGPPLDGAQQALERAPEIHKLAETIVAPDIGAAAAQPMIDAFAADQPAGEARRRRLTLLFAAVLEESNLYRRFVLEGIVAMMGRRRLAAEALARSELAYQSRAAETSDEAQAERKALEQRRFWQQRAFDEAEDEARFLCHRLTTMEGKLGRLTRAIAGHL